jgi:hypothetical protein
MLIQWTGSEFTLGDFEFVSVFDQRIGHAHEEHPRYVLMKDQLNVQSYVDNLTAEARTVLELGIMKGGSCAFFEALLRPTHHLAIDIADYTNGALRPLVEHVSRDRRCFMPTFGVSQADIPTVQRHWEAVAGRDRRLDLIVDDASHDYELSLQSFNGLFPMLREGGIYALEDWGWAHWGGPWQDPNSTQYGEPALSNLVAHTVLSSTGGSGFVHSVKVTANAAYIERGSNPQTTPFDVRETFLSRGRGKAPF